MIFEEPRKAIRYKSLQEIAQPSIPLSIEKDKSISEINNLNKEAILDKKRNDSAVYLSEKSHLLR